MNRQKLKRPRVYLMREEDLGAGKSCWRPKGTAERERTQHSNLRPGPPAPSHTLIGSGVLPPRGEEVPKDRENPRKTG